MDFRFVRVESEGLGIVFVSAALCLIFALLGFFFLFVVFALFTVFFVFFFRDPERDLPPLDPGSVICPADGKVIDISEIFEDNYLKQNTRRISIFLSVFESHPEFPRVIGSPDNFAGNGKSVYMAVEDREENAYPSRVLLKVIVFEYF